MRRGRKQRHDAPPVASAVRAGLAGGQYKPLTEREIERIHHTALDVLENIGVGDPIPILQEHALAKGCKIDEHGRLCFPRALVEDVLAHAGKADTWCGRDPVHDLDLSGTRVHTYGGGEAVSILDVGADHYRPSTVLDQYDLARLVDQLDNVHAYSRLVVATELTDLLVADINSAYASVAGTTKHTALHFADPKHVQPTLEMMHLIAGGEKQFKERPFCHAGGCTIVSPLRYGTENCEVCIEATKFGSPVWAVTAPQAGATAPAALAGTLVLVTAEILASLLLIDLVVPQYPVIMGPWPFVSDLRTGAFTGGSGEEAVVSAAAIQIVNHYDLVSSTGAGMTDAKVPDNQAGYERGITVSLAALAGCNAMAETTGMLGSLMGCSYESMVIDNDMLGNVLRAVRGIEVTDETLSYDIIKDVVHGDGHFLRQQQTLDLMRTEYEYPEIGDRGTPDEWETAGSPTARQRGGERAVELLANHYPEYIDPAIDDQIRDRYPIVISREDMKPGNGRW